MKQLFLCFLFIPLFVIGQETDSIYWKVNLSDVIITATRTKSSKNNIPNRISVLKEDDILHHPSSNLDDILQSIPGVYVNRSAGIFSKNSSLTMRGLDATNRVLVLYDGIPLNKAAGGGINWHMVDEDAVSKVEVINGSNSALYGGNAMAGIINIFTKLPDTGFVGKLQLSTATFNTKSAKIMLSNSKVKNDKGAFFTSNVFYRKGDGYYFVKEENKDSNDAKLFLDELGANVKFGYIFSKNTKLIFNFNVYHDKRGDGIKIFEKDGGYYDNLSNVLMCDFYTSLGVWNMNMKTFFHRENLTQHTERLNSTGDTYKLYDVFQTDQDAGILTSFDRIIKKHRIATGLDFKFGNMNAHDLYRTSMDEVFRKGSLSFLAAFLQDEIFLNNKWRLVLGLRLEHSSFLKGSLDVLNPSATTGFTKSLNEEFSSTQWYNFSPKLAILYKLNPKINLYSSYSQGFIPPKLDDMVSSRKISKGFKNANPNLKPEYSNNFEMGLNYKPNLQLEFESNVFYTIGRDFQYFVQTGDTIDGTSLVFQRVNIGEVQVAGLELEMKYAFNKNLLFRTNYTYNHSEITHFQGISDAGISLKGKFISETPEHQAYFGFVWKNKIANFSLAFNYIGQQWGDEANLLKLDPYQTIDVKLFHEFRKFLSVSMQIQNVLDNRYVDKKDGIAPGRFVEFSLIGRLGK